MNAKELTTLESNLINFFRAGNLIPLVGSGISTGTRTRKRGQVPSGNEYKRYMIKEIKKSGKLNEREVAQLEVKTFSDIVSYYEKDVFVSAESRLEYFKENFYQAAYSTNDIRMKFFNVDWPYIYSLNIDDAIEASTSYKEVILPCRAIREEIFSERKCIIKLHGDISEIIKYADAQKVFSKQEYISSIDNNKLLLTKIKNDFENQNIIIVGCSFDDEIDLLYTSNHLRKKRNGSSLSKVILCTTKEPTVLERSNYEDYGITDIVVFQDYNSIYNTVYTAWVKSKEIPVSSLDDYCSFKGYVLDESPEENQKYFYYGTRLLSVQEKRVYYPYFFTTRLTMKRIEDILRNNKVHLFSGRRISGRSYLLADFYRYVNDRPVYFFDSSSRISDSSIDELLRKEQILALFDIRSIDRGKFEKIINNARRIHGNRSNFIIMISKNDSDMLGIVKWRLRFQEIDKTDINEQSIENMVFEKEAFNVLNKAYAAVDIPQNLNKKSFLDHIIYSQTIMGCESRFTDIRISLSEDDDFRAVKELALLIVFAVNERITTQDVIKFDMESVIFDSIKLYTPMIEEEHTHLIEKTKADISDKKYVLNSRYWLIKQLGEYILAPDNVLNVTKAYKYIVERIIAYHGGELRFVRKYLRNYILFDVMNDIFMQKNSLDIRLLLYVYQGLHTLLATDYQYLHQYAKCYINCAKKSEQGSKTYYYQEGLKHCNLALANVEADLEKNKNEKLMISKSHIQCTLTFLLIDLYSLLENEEKKRKFGDRIIELIYEKDFNFIENDMEDLYDKPKDAIKDFLTKYCIDIRGERSSPVDRKLEQKLEHVMKKMIQET